MSGAYIVSNKKKSFVKWKKLPVVGSLKAAKYIVILLSDVAVWEHLVGLGPSFLAIFLSLLNHLTPWWFL